MNYSSQILFFLSALGIFNSIILSSFFVFLKKNKAISDFFLSGLLLVLSIRIGKSVFFYFNNSLSKIYLQVGLSACFFIGPMLYFFVKAKLQNLNFAFTKYTLAFLLLVTIIFGILFPYQEHASLWGNQVYCVINYQWLFFIFLSIYAAKSVFYKLFHTRHLITKDDIWVMTIIAGVSIIWISYFTGRYTSYISGALTFSFSFYISFLVIIYTKSKPSVTGSTKEKYINKIDETLAKEIQEKITVLFESQKIYTNPNLTLPLLAQELKVRPQLLSQFINDNLNKSFAQFINEYRIEEAKQLLKKNTHLKIDTVGMECGFNSSSSFYSTFKKITGTTPSNYQKT
ncbi:MAG: helix-turn-helix transcriptional regulator [Raineya sp.]|jgi:AraC-like DNA-binding protein|nr:helix-turn-helix transcriptional regulator [Raineya sp.]